MKENKRRSLVVVIISVVILILIVGRATYAFFATSTDLDGDAINTNVTTAESMYSFSATSNGNIEWNVGFNEMGEASTSIRAIKTNDSNITVSLASPSNDIVTSCTYDIVWIWDSEDKYTVPDVTLPYEDPEKIVDGHNVINNYEFSVKIYGLILETDLSNFDYNDGKVTLYKGAEIVAGKSTVTKTYNISTKLYNLPVNQKNIFNKNFKAHMTIDNLDCNMNKVVETLPSGKTLSSAIIEQKNRYNSSLNWGIVEENGIRYQGEDPDNYICFENECSYNQLYRIIGVFSENGENLTKIISKSPVATGVAWDTNGGYDWPTSSSYNLLGDYYTSLSENTKSMIESVNWQYGKIENSMYPNEVYEIESNPLTPSVNSPVGLIYASDYLYAPMRNKCLKNTPISNYGCSNWLYDAAMATVLYARAALIIVDGYVYTLATTNDKVYNIYNPKNLSADFIIDSTWNNIDSWTSSNYKLDLRNSIFNDEGTMLLSSFYLNTNVKIISGSGQQYDPYIIGL